MPLSQILSPRSLLLRVQSRLIRLFIKMNMTSLILHPKPRSLRTIRQQGHHRSATNIRRQHRVSISRHRRGSPSIHTISINIYRRSSLTMTSLLRVRATSNTTSSRLRSQQTFNILRRINRQNLLCIRGLTTSQRRNLGLQVPHQLHHTRHAITLSSRRFNIINNITTTVNRFNQRHQKLRHVLTPLRITNLSNYRPNAHHVSRLIRYNLHINLLSPK